MKRMLMLVALAALTAVFTGCTSSTRIVWGGKMAVRQPDGTVLVDATGTPHYESEQNVYKDSNWLTAREERDVKVKVNADGSYEASIIRNNVDKQPRQRRQHQRHRHGDRRTRRNH